MAKHPPPWLFGIVGIPYGAGGAFVGLIMPFMADAAHIDIDQIGWFVTLLFVPPMIQFLYAPIVDIGPKRKYWLIIVSVLGAASFAAAFAMPLPASKTAYLVFAFFGQMLTGLTGSCNGGLLALTMPDELRGRASAWLNVGNLTGGSGAAWLTNWLLNRGVSTTIVGLVFAAMIVLPSLAILIVDEPKRHWRSVHEVFGDMWRSVRTVLFSKSGLTGIALCLSPVGTAALANFFSGMGSAFGADKDLVATCTGAATGIPSAIGAAVCGWLCDRYNRRGLYLLSGAMTAVVGIGLALVPRTPDTYLWGVMTYALVTGFCYSAFTATILETIGQGGAAASTQYALFVAAGNIAIGYTGFINTRFGGKVALPDGTTRPDVGGVITSDAALNLIGVAVLAFVFWRLGSFGKSRHKPATSPTAA